MIARMSKYDFILYAGQSDDFIERLRELGLVDVTCRGWEPSEGDRQLVTAIEGRTKAFFTAQRDAFEKSRDAWNEQAPVEVIHETSSTVWFVAVSHEGAELSFDAQEVKAPAMTAHDAEAKVASLRSRLSATDAEMSRAAASAALIGWTPCWTNIPTCSTSRATPRPKTRRP